MKNILRRAWIDSIALFVILSGAKDLYDALCEYMDSSVPKPRGRQYRRPRRVPYSVIRYYSNSAAGAGVTTLPSSTVNLTSLLKG